MVDLEELFIEKEGVRMRTLAAGGGEPLLLVHGFGASSDSWFFNIGALAEHYRVYAVDLPGFGESTKVAMESLSDFAAWLDQLLEENGHDSAHVAGNSMGGAVSIQFALQFPRRVRSLILVDPLGLGEFGTTDFEPRMLSARNADEVREMFTLIFHDPAVILDAMIERQVALREDADALRVLEQVGLQLDGWRAAFRDRLGEVKVPIQVVWGREDRIIPVANSEAVQGLSHVQTHIFDDCGHLPHVEMPGAFNELVLKFLSSANPRG